jgi:hypothetical protein
MVVLYTTLVLLLGVATFLIKRRVAALERRYTRVAKEADQLVRQASFKEGNSSRFDPYQNAKRQYRLALVAQKRDRVEARYAAWQARAERCERLTAAVRGWKGRKLPYTLGVLDVGVLLSVIDYLGVGPYDGFRRLLAAAVSLFVKS